MHLRLIRTLALTALAWAHAASAQTAWPDAMATLLPAPSESGLAAVLPPDVVVTPPDAALGADRARWSGLWQGWACRAWQCDVRLAVEKLSATGATLVYAGANTVQGRITDRVEAQFANGELSARLRTGARLALRLRATGDMEFTLWKPDTQLLSMGLLSQKPPPYSRRIERVPTPWADNGKPQTLEMVVYQPAGPGPFPTLVFNHGSTGNGDKPEWFTATWTAPTIAQHFTAQGWQVLMPQRRGRGKSDGLYDEGFEPDRSRYSCRPELTLPGLERAIADLDAVMASLPARGDVNLQRVMIGGVSRGGILSVAYAGTRPQAFVGVINFVGGWVGDRCWYADKVNPVSFARGAALGKPMLWLYGDKDPFYSLRHSRSNFEAFVAAGGKGQFLTFDPVAGQNGHGIHNYPELWQPAVDAYLKQVQP